MAMFFMMITMMMKIYINDDNKYVSKELHMAFVSLAQWHS